MPLPTAPIAETVAIERSLLLQYMTPEEKPKDPLFTRHGGAMWCRSSEMVEPPRQAGSMYGGCNYFTSQDFDAYLYVPGQRRVRKAPEIGFYDSPSTGSDGLRTADSTTMFGMTGDEEWYEYSAAAAQGIFHSLQQLQTGGARERRLQETGHAPGI